MSNEPDNLVLELLRGIRADVARVDSKVDDTKAKLKADIHSLRADMASDLATTRRDVIDRLARLRGRLPGDFIFDRDEANAR